MRLKMLRRLEIRYQFLAFAAMAAIVAWLAILVIGRANNQVCAADVDQGSVTIGLQRTAGQVITETGIAQQFSVPTSAASPSCDSGAQSVGILGVAIDLRAYDSLQCFRHSSNVVVSVRRQRYGKDLGSVRVAYEYPMAEPETYVARFDPPLVVQTNTPHYVVVRHERGSSDVSVDLAVA